MKNYAGDDVVVPSRVHIANGSMKSIRISNDLKYGLCYEITMYGDEYIFEL